MKTTQIIAGVGVVLFAVGVYLVLVDGFSKLSGALLFAGLLAVGQYFVFKNNPTITG